jgi:hypothetical protein
MYGAAVTEDLGSANVARCTLEARCHHVRALLAPSLLYTASSSSGSSGHRRGVLAVQLARRKQPLSRAVRERAEWSGECARSSTSYTSPCVYGLGHMMNTIYMNDDHPRLASLNTAQHTAPTQHCTQHLRLASLHSTTLITIQHNTCMAQARPSELQVPWTRCFLS